MQVLAIFLVLIPLASAQFPPRLRNPNFRNIQTPLATSASKQRPYVSIPIVLLPDGQVVPKPRQVNYHFVGNAPTPKFQSQDKERSARSKGLSSGRPIANYQVIIQSPASHSEQKKKSSPAVPQGNSQVRGNAFKQQYSSLQQMQQNRPQKPLQSHHIQIQTSTQNQQGYRTPNSQQKTSTNQQNAAHKQAVANFVNFATTLGASVTGQQVTRLQQNFQQIAHVPSSDTGYDTTEGSKSQEGYLPQQTQATNQKQTDPTFFTQLQNSQNIHQPYPQQIIQAQPNIYHNQQLQQTQNQVAISSQNPKQQSLTSSTRHPVPTPNSHANIQQLTNMPQQNFASNLYLQQNQPNIAQPNSYASTTQHTIQQSYNTSPSQNAGHQSYTSVSQQVNNPVLIHSRGNTKSQSQLLKNSAVAQTEFSSYPNINSVQQQVYSAANQASPSPFLLNSLDQQANYASTAQVAPLTYTSQQNPEAASFPSQASQTTAGQTGSQTTYVSLQSVQDAQANYVPSVNNGQINYVPVSQASQQTDQSQQNNDQTYTLMQNAQNVYANQNVPSVYPPQSQSASTASTSSSLEPGVQIYNPYTNEQVSYTPSGQQTQANYANTAQSGKIYQPSQYSYVIQNPQDGKTTYSTESQETENESTIGSGQLIYASSTAKQTNSAQTAPHYSVSQGEAVSYASFPSGYKTDSSSYALSQKGVVTPGTTYAKVTQSSSTQTSEDYNEQHEDDEDGDDEEASYKVVYIPLDILKNILSNSIESQS
ncbi:hypothetical protein X975_18590, partial [Stegodyphus mimosarum]